MTIHRLILRTLQILSILMTGLNAGLFFIFSYDVNIAFEQLTGAEYGYSMKIINEAIRNPWFFTVFFGSIALPIVTLLVWRRSYRTPAFLLFLAGFLIYLALTFAVTTAINLPLNVYLESWDLAAVPADWTNVRDSWNQANMVRTWGAIAAFALYLVGLTVSAETSKNQPLLTN